MAREGMNDMKTSATFLIALMVAVGVGAGPSEDMKPGTAQAIFAGGCFWCLEADFDKVPGVLETISGYTGGHVPNPSYEQVSAGGTGHAESVKVVYDPSKVSYRELVDYFWHHVDPTQENGQFCDHGDQYRTAIFYASDEQREVAERSKEQLERTKPFAGAIVTEIVPAGPFYPAEAYHQDYYEKNPIKYKYYRWRCGRDQRVEELWGEE